MAISYEKNTTTSILLTFKVHHWELLSSQSDELFRECPAIFLT